MTFLVLHADRLATALADDPLVPAADVGRVQDALALLAEAGDLRRGAEATIDAAREAARIEGFAAGRAEGLAAAEAERQAELFRIALRDSELQRERQKDIARLALEVVRRIAGELDAGAMVAGLAERAAAQLTPDSVAMVRVAPAAVAAVRARLDGRVGLSVEADPSLEGQDCVIETALGRTHAGLDTQLAQIERMWGEALNG
ncbi:FliH/SctL family protein [Sphingomonas sp. DG1-23]|uniref:FliH/SctL family protein n=1 Tax=Sphingomonas sp. DG1-23 TaxID=3068316 RepID=UPI00273D482F|nr:FliH/SctL family protein [Sphingomonas sp. DG1-23]MDP5279635.1 FliH/SctL family protein [Sphingomonas sp. DG1-23]